MDKHYILRSRDRIYTAAGSRVTVIGQSEGCDVRVANRSPYEDVIFAKIVPDRDGEGWHIVKVTHFYPVRVNGVEMNRVHYLSDGDNLDFGNETYRFMQRDGDNNDPGITHIHSGGKMIRGMAVIIAAIAVIVGWIIYDNQRERLTGTMISEIESSLFRTSVDSLQLVYGDSIVDSYTYTSAPSGTAFLTSDSMLVTARHCIQPWLNRMQPHEYQSIPSVTEWPMIQALYAETENQLNGTDKWHIRSFVTISDEAGNVRSVTSDEFIVNQDLDEIVELGSYDDPKYWRSISHRYSRRDMMLGDIAVMRYDKAGSIDIADKNRLRTLLPHRGVRLTFFGYPESGVNGNMLEYKSDELRLPLDTLPGESDRIFLLAHGGELSRGFSGGPVIVRDGIGFRAAGVISVVDERNNARSYSVPTSEIFNLNKR